MVGTGTQTATYTPDAATNGSGTVDVNGGLIHFTGLEPVDIESMAAVNVHFPNGNDVVNVDDGTTSVLGDDAIVVSGTSNVVPFESVALRNNTTVTITDMHGNAVAWGSSGKAGFKGSKKSTPFAATVVAEQCARDALGLGVKRVHVRVQGPGSGRESAIQNGRLEFLMQGPGRLTRTARFKVKRDLK